ncbi:hypothetical protein [Aureimonas glaciei]|uniref:hypothetical protein n=1 Tax=Aureimonas glaciei TaxID=1776957 RepID=UPI00166D04A3|nr:hypothetical protein [Aureimonas glaciei]
MQQIVKKGSQPIAPSGLGKNAVTVIRNVLEIEGRPLLSADIMTFVENGHLHKGHPNFGQRSVDAISAAYVAYTEDRSVMAHLVRSPGAFADAMQMKKRTP